MTYELTCKLWQYSLVLALLVWTFLFFRIIYGIYKKRKTIIKSTIKYFLNTISFLFVYAVYFSFYIVVQAPIGQTKNDSLKMLNDWVNKESLNWLFWALLLTAIITLFNIIYQLKIEKIKDNQKIIMLTILNLLLMMYGIFLGSSNAITGLTEEINRHKF